MQIDPQYIIPLVYQLTDPTDSTLYYIRAVVKESLYGTVLTTANLTHQGSGRYTGSVRAPQDSNGQGTHIDITISIYTDSGYTTYSDVYSRQIDKFLVKKTSNLFSGGGGVDVDYKKIEKHFQTEATNILKEVGINKFDLSPVIKQFKLLENLINSIEIPEIPKPKEINLSPTNSLLIDVKTSVIKAIEEKEVTKQNDVDLSPIIDSIENLNVEIASIKETMPALIQDVKKMLDEFFKNNIAAQYAELEKKNVSKIQKLRNIRDILGEDDMESIPSNQGKDKNNVLLDKYFK